MKMIWNRIQLFTLLALGVAVMVFYVRSEVLADKLAEKEEENKFLYSTLDHQEKQWKDQANHWRNEAEANAISSKTLKELYKNGDPRITALYDGFKSIKKNSVQSFSNTTTHNETRFNVKIKDTTIYGDTLRSIKYNDGFLSIDGVIKDDSLDGIVEYTDSLAQVVYKKQKKILFIPIGKVSYQSQIVSKNPNTKIVVNDFILIKKKR